jgi:hypothetical protein
MQLLLNEKVITIYAPQYIFVRKQRHRQVGKKMLDFNHPSKAMKAGQNYNFKNRSDFWECCQNFEGAASVVTFRGQRQSLCIETQR